MVVGNRIGELINKKIAGSSDPDEKRKEVLASLEKLIPKNRLTGLIKGTFKMHLDEAFYLKKVLECSTVEEVLVLHED